MSTVTLTPTACTYTKSGFENLYYYGNTSNLRQLIFTFPNNAELAAGGVAITSITLHYYVRNSSSVAKQLMYGFKTGTSAAPTAWATMDGQNVVEDKFTAIPGVSKQTTKNATKSYSEGSILIDWLLQEMQAGNPVYLGVVQPTSGNSIQVYPSLNYWKIDVTYEIRGNIPSTDTDTITLGDTVTINVDRVLTDSTTKLQFSMGETTTTVDIGTAESYKAYIEPEWGEDFPDTTVGSMTIAAVTYVDGVEYGTVTTEITVNLPSNANPGVEAAHSRTWIAGIPTASQIDAYVQNQSGVNVAYISDAMYGAKISDVSLTIENATYSSVNASGAFAHSPLTTSGTVTYILTVTDSRGLSSTYSDSLTVLPWSAPKIQTFTVNRATEEGIEALDGTCALTVVKASVTSLVVSGAEKNSYIFTVYYREILEDGEAEWTATDSISVADISGSVSRLLTSGSTTLDIFNDMAGYEFQVVIKDLFGSSTAYDSMPTKLVYVDIDESTGYVGFGGSAPEEDSGVGYLFYNPVSLPSGSMIDIYSTEPTPIGAWIDGRTIYRQVFDLGDITVAKGNVTTVLVSGTPTYDILVDLKAFGRWGTGDNWCVIPRIWTTTTGTLSIDYASSMIRLRSIHTAAFTLCDVYVFVEFVLAADAVATLSLDDENDISTNDPDDTDAIAELQAEVATLKAQVAALTKENTTDGY